MKQPDMETVRRHSEMHGTLEPMDPTFKRNSVDRHDNRCWCEHCTAFRNSIIGFKTTMDDSKPEDASVTQCTSPMFGSGEVYRCSELDCLIHGERNRMLDTRLPEDVFRGDGGTFSGREVPLNNLKDKFGID